jgi:hypothetical protein
MLSQPASLNTDLSLEESSRGACYRSLFGELCGVSLSSEAGRVKAGERESVLWRTDNGAERVIFSLNPFR